MLKSGYNILRILNGKSRHRIRTNSYWTDSYPSPEPSRLIKTVNKTCDWIFNSLDNFFQGTAIRNRAEIINDLAANNTLNSTQVEWELNQDIVDIAYKDIKSSLSWMIPNFIRKHAIRLHQLSLLYLFTDVIDEEEYVEWAVTGNNSSRAISDKGKVLYAIQAIKDRIKSNCLRIDIWWKKFIIKLKAFLKPGQKKKTYYLLGYFAAQGYDYTINSQNYMIRGPDKTKLNPAFSFHKRI